MSVDSTTVRVSDTTHEALEEAKRITGLRSVDAVIRKYMADNTPDAKTLYIRNRAKVRAACDEHGIQVLVAFGSRVRDDRLPGSDLDLVAEFDGAPSIFGLAKASHDLSAAFGVQVDLGTMPPDGSRLRRHIDKEGVVLVE